MNSFKVLYNHCLLADHLVLMKTGRVLAAGRLRDLQSDPSLPLAGSRGFYVRAERGSLPPRGRVGDWRAGLGRSLCSLLPRPFGCKVSQHLDRAAFPVPATSNARCGFPAFTLTCLLHLKGHGTYPAGATFDCSRLTL